MVSERVRGAGTTRAVRESWGVLTLLLVVATLVVSCGPKQRKSDYESWKAGTELTGDFDEAEARWRREISQNPWSQQDMNHDMSLLTDDPPKAPDAYGEVVSSDEMRQPGGDVAFVENAEDREPESDTWSNVGMASFSAFTVLFTVGMAVAPYLLL